MQLAVAFAASTLFTGSGLLSLGIFGASLAYQLMQKGKEQGKLNDMRISCSTYGRGIPIVWGTMRCTGNMFWATDLVEHKHKFNSAGKNKDKKSKSKDKWNTVYEYTANFAMGLCEGPVEEVIRIWADSNLIYNKFAGGLASPYYDPNSGQPYDPLSGQMVRPGFSHADGTKKGRKGNVVDGTFNWRFYHGTEDQLPDPFMVGTQGPESVPAFRGLSYLMFEDFALADFGNRIPTITAEVAWKKRPMTTYGTLDNLPSPPSYALGDRAFFDPQRQRLYHFHVAFPTGSVLRAFDIQSNKEVMRRNMSDLFPCERIIGLTGVGDIVGTGGSENCNPIYIIDGTTLMVKQTIGSSGVFVNAGAGRYGWPMMAVPGQAIDEHGNSQLITIVLMQFLDILTLDQDNKVLNFTQTHLGSLFHSGGSISPGTPAFESSVVYLKQPATLGSATIWQFQIDANFDKHDPIADLLKDHVPQPSTECLYAGDFHPGVDLGWTLTDPFLVAGAECVGLVEQVLSNDPDRNGVYVVKLNPFATLNAIDTSSLGDGGAQNLSVTKNDGSVNTADLGFNPSTRKVLWRKKVSNDPSDFPNSNMTQVPVAGNDYAWIRGNTAQVFQVDFVNETVDSITLPAGLPAEEFGQMYWSPEKSIAMMIDVGGEKKWAQAFIDRATFAPLSIKDIVLDVARRVNIDPGRIDSSKLDEIDVMGFLLENPASGRGIIEDLAKVFLFDVTESDYTLKFVSRGQTPVMVIPQDDLGVVKGHEMEGVTGELDFYGETRMQEIDLPMRVNVSYIDPSNLYQATTAHYKRPNSPFPVVQTRETVDLNLPMALTADQAKQMAYNCLYSAWMERTTHDYVLPWTYLVLDPTDVVTFEMNDGLKFTDRLIGLTIGADFSAETKAVTQYAASYSSNVKMKTPGGVIPIDHPKMPGTRPIAFDIPYLEDAQAKTSGVSFYWGVTALSDGFDFASVAVRIGTAQEISLGYTPAETVWGTVLGTVPPPARGNYATDDITKITLFPGHDWADADIWESIQESEWPSHGNTILIGGEIMYFRDVTQNADGTVTISHLIRGARGTEDAAYRHSQNERWAMIGHNGLMFEATEDLATLNQKYVLKSYSPSLVPIPLTCSFNMTGASEKPYAPEAFKRAEAAGDITITWQRRTRYDGGLKDGTGTVPLNEEAESYEVYILTAPYDPATFDPGGNTTYKRAFTGLTSATLTYTAAELATDGHAITDTIHLVAFQISAKVGRGFPGWVSLEHKYFA